MRTISIPVILLGLAYALFAVSLAYAAERLPDVVATHFGGEGVPNGWMSRSGNLLFLVAVAVGVPLLIIGSCAVSRFFPVRTFHVPNRAYWLSSERRCQTTAYMTRHSLWLASWTVLFVTAINLLIVAANSISPPRLSNTALFVMLGIFVAGVGAWSFFFYGHFWRIA